MKSVLLISQSPRHRGMFINILPPIGILGIASFLESRGVPVTVKDCAIEPLHDEELGGADIIGLSVNISNVEKSLETARHVKKQWPAKLVIAGGPLGASIPERLLGEGCLDAVAAGEGEEIVSEIAAGRDLSHIRGLYVRGKNGECSFTGERDWISDLDRLPFPALQKVDLDRYYSPIKKSLPISNLISSRGCPYGCIYCFKTMGNRWRARSAGNVVDEIQWQVRTLGVQEICIYDDNFTMDTARAEAIGEEIIRRGIKVHLQLTNGIRADRVTRQALRTLKAAGVWIVGIAPESGNAETLQKIHKGFDLETVTRVRRWCREEGISTYSFFMMGFPWETESHIADTIRYATTLDTELTQFSRVTAFPGTQLYAIIGKKQRETPPLRDQGIFYGGVLHDTPGLSPDRLARLIRRAYARVYLRPGKMLRLLRMLSLRDLWHLFWYSIRTGSI